MRNPRMSLAFSNISRATVVIVEVLAHTYELRTLTGEYKCLHNVYVIGKLLNKATKLRIFPQLRSHLGLNSYLYIHKLHILTSID